MNRNIRIFFAAEFLKGIYVAYAIATLFYRALGISYTQITLLWLAMSLASVVLEIPFGLLSDRIGHRKVILLGYLALASAVGLIGSGTDFWLPFAGGAMWGVSTALLSGSSDAFLYDSLKACGREASYMRLKGVHSSLRSLGIVVGSIPGPYLYSLSIRYPWFLQAGCILLGFIIFTFSKKVNGFDRQNAQPASFKSGFTFIGRHKELLWLTLFTALVIFPLYGMSVIRQPYLLERHFKLVQLGYLFAGIEVIGFLTGLTAHRIERRLGLSGSPLATVTGLTSIYIMLAVIPNRWALLPLVCLYAVFRFQAIILNAYSNDRIPSEQRATILSIQSMGGSILLIVFMLSSGIILDTFEINSYLVALATYLAVFVFPLWLFRKRFEIR